MAYTPLTAGAIQKAELDAKFEALELAAATKGNTRLVTGATTTTDEDDWVIVNSASPVTVTLHSAAAATHPIGIKRIGAGAVTVDGAGSETIDGATTKVLSTSLEAHLFVPYSSTAWAAF
jgi:hypothetical protein